MMKCCIITTILILVSSLASAAVELKVGLYNSIPDLDGDQLASYKRMVETNFDTEARTVEAVVDEQDYSPYENLAEYLNGDFDMIEIDTASLTSVVDLIVETDRVLQIPSATLHTAKAAVTVNSKHYGYPTLLCGNFLIALSSPGTRENCPLEDIESYTDLQREIATCQNNYPSYDRIYGGKFSDTDGWYLPFFYLDGYVDKHGVDKHGVSSAAAAVQNLLNGNYDRDICMRLKWFIDVCGEKCTDKNAEGSYVETFDNLVLDIENKKTLNFVGFSEMTAELIQKAGVTPISATSWPLDSHNHILQFTDALVVSKKVWEEADNDKKDAIRDFIKYFTANDLRRKIALGKDLSPPRDRYLLQATHTFYESVPQYPIYREIYKLLQSAVAAPSLSDEDRETMQNVLFSALTDDCGTKTEL